MSCVVHSHTKLLKLSFLRSSRDLCPCLTKYLEEEVKEEGEEEEKEEGEEEDKEEGGGGRGEEEKLHYVY